MVSEAKGKIQHEEMIIMYTEQQLKDNNKLPCELCKKPTKQLILIEKDEIFVCESCAIIRYDYIPE